MIGYNKPFKGIIHSFSVPEVSYPLFGIVCKDGQELTICTTVIIACRYIAKDSFIVETLNSVYIVIIK